jgi:hypothetical protein
MHTLTLDDFATINWEDAVLSAERDDLSAYANAFYARAYEAQQKNNPRAELALTLLGHLCSLGWRLDTPAQPFHQIHMSDTFRSASPKDIPSEHVEVLRMLAPTVRNPKLRARMADFVWVRARGFPMAQLAVETYLEIAHSLQNPELPWTRAVRDLERAIQLAVQLSRKSDPFERTSVFVTDLLVTRGPTETGFFSHHLLGLAAKFGIGDPVKWHDLAAQIAERAETAADWHRAERYWLAAEERREAIRRVSETYVARASEAADRPHVGKIIAATHLQHAIEALRRASGMRERVNELHVLMMGYQQDIPSSLIAFSHEIPIADAAAEARKAVAGKPLDQALFAFALHPYIPQCSDLRRNAEEVASKYMLKAFFPAVQHNREGKVVARQGSTNAVDPEQREAALRADMIQHAVQYYHVAGTASVHSAREQILEEHSVRIQDFFWIVANNPLVPAGREMLYAEAFFAGFVRDMAKAIHILVHQIEHSIRELLARAGVIVTSLDQYGIQSERNLNGLLYEAKLKELLGVDMVFSLQSLLVEKFGPDVRNRVAHGLVPHHEFFHSTYLYLWWLSFRLICVPIINSINAVEKPEPAEGTSPGS